MTASERFSLTLSLIAMAPLVLGLLLLAILAAPPQAMPLMAGADQAHSAPEKDPA